MTAPSEDRQEVRGHGPGTGALSALLVFIAACFAANDLLVATALPGSIAWRPLGTLALNLLMVGAIWVLSRLEPTRQKAWWLLMLLAGTVLAGFGVCASVLKALVASGTLAGPWPWRTVYVFVSNLFIGGGGILALSWLRPWRQWQKEWREWKAEPVSAATRRSNKLLGLKELGGMLGMLVLFLGTFSPQHPFAIFSNGPVPLWIAMLAIAMWLTARVVREWWHHRADEHEQRASDFGRRVGTGVFLAVTPAWWVAARAGLLPQPDAMVLWVGIYVVTSIAWSWRRSH